MSVFILRVIRQMGMQVVHEDQFHGFVPYYSGELGFQTYDLLEKEIKKMSKELCAWLVPDDEHAKAASETSGKSAPISEGGYRAVANMHSPMDMRDFLSRVLKDMHMTVLNKGGMMGFIPFHDCEHGAKTLKAMRSEVFEAAQKKTWVREMEQKEIKAMEEEEVSAKEKQSKEDKEKIKDVKEDKGKVNQQGSDKAASKKNEEGHSSKSGAGEGSKTQEEARSSKDADVDASRPNSKSDTSKKDDSSDDTAAAMPATDKAASSKETDTHPPKKTDERPLGKDDNAEPLEGHSVDYVEESGGNEAAIGDRKKTKSSKGSDDQQLDLPKVNKTSADLLEGKAEALDGGAATTPEHHKDSSPKSTGDHLPEDHDKSSPDGTDARPLDLLKVKRKTHPKHKDVSPKATEDRLPEDHQAASPPKTDAHPVDLLKIKKQANAPVLDRHHGADSHGAVTAKPDDHAELSLKVAHKHPVKKHQNAELHKVPKAEKKLTSLDEKQEATKSDKRKSKSSSPTAKSVKKKATKAEIEAEIEAEIQAEMEKTSKKISQKPPEGILYSQKKSKVSAEEKHEHAAAPKKGRRKAK